MTWKIVALLVFALHMTAGQALAQEHGEKERKADIARHRAMAAAHESMAKCLESGKAEKDCLAELAKACKGLGIGRYCGMRHTH